MPEALSQVVVDPTAGHSATVVWLHGLGADGHDFAPIVPALTLPWVRFVFPHAPMRAVTINFGAVMRAWYDIRSIERRSDRENPEHIREAAASIDDLLESELERGIPPDRLVLAGFSQGAAMTLYCGTRFPRRLGGLLVLSGYTIGEAGSNEEAGAAMADAPVFFGHGSRDGVVPISKGREAFARFAASGRPCTWHDYRMGHEVCPQEVADVAAWLRDVLPETP